MLRRPIVGALPPHRILTKIPPGNLKRMRISRSYRGCIICFYGTNNFAVKKLLLHDNGKTEDGIILSIEQRTADAAVGPCKAGKIIAKKYHRAEKSSRPFL